ncbi:hypothetical protein [Pedobacter frigidisoli]|nr:hypothetical protein [Pedobacter frigidisoli]
MVAIIIVYILKRKSPKLEDSGKNTEPAHEELDIQPYSDLDKLIISCVLKHKKIDGYHDINELLEITGYLPEFEQIIIKSWTEQEHTNPDLQMPEFLNSFLTTFHNTQLVQYAPDFVRERNDKFIKAFDYIRITVQKIQGWLDNEDLRKIIETDLLTANNTPITLAAIKELATYFCFVSIGCDGLGRYNLVYSIDYRFQEMLSGPMASTLIRRINEYTEQVETFVYIGSLHKDCIQYFNEKVATELSHNQKLTVTPMHD